MAIVANFICVISICFIWILFMAYFLSFDCMCGRFYVPKHNLKRFFSVKYFMLLYNEGSILFKIWLHLYKVLCQGITCGIWYFVMIWHNFVADFNLVHNLCGRFYAFRLCLWRFSTLQLHLWQILCVRVFLVEFFIC